MAGGSATHAGIGFQDKVAGLLSVHILADAPVGFLELPTNVTPTSIELETSAPVDDILVSTSVGGFCFINVKKGVALSRKPDSPLGSVLDQFVRLWIACQSGRSQRSWQRPLEATRDRLVLATSGDRSARFTGAFSKLLGRITDRASIVPRETIASTASERDTYDAVLELLRLAFRRHTGEESSDGVITSLLTITRVVVLDPDGRDKPNALALLKTAVIADPSEAERAWVELVSECQRLSEARSGADRPALRNTLTSRGVRLLGVPQIAADVRQLEQFTGDTLSSLSHLAHLDLPTATGIERTEIHRSVTDALAAHAPRTSLLVIGEPGSGKSGALYSAAQRLIADGHPVVAIAVDRHPVRTLDDLRRDICLDRPLIEVLRNWSSDKEGVLIIDALDATRGGPSDGVFQELIRRVIRDAPNWCVVASIRDFDLRFGVIYRDLFLGQPLDSTYRGSGFENVTHILIPQLTEHELDQVWTKSPLMADAYRQGSAALRSLLHSPFNLFLLANVLSAGLRDLRDVTTQVQLLDRYWSYRVIGGDQRGFARERLLQNALDWMLKERRLQVALQDVKEVQTEDLFRLHSEGVLAPVDSTQDRVARISFAHHVLFDYGVARLSLESGRAPDFAARLTSSDERALLIAPGAMMALQVLWQEDAPGRPAFWKKSFEVAGTEATGAFCRMLPARVAATLTSDLQDFETVLDCLRQPDCPDRTAAVFLVRHCTGALTAGAIPPPTPTSPRGAWPLIARALAEASIADVGWMLKPLIGEWVDKPAGLTPDEKTEIGSTARLMLRYGSGDQYDSSMVIVGIQGVARTFASAPAESVESLNRLLAREHVIAHGHEELSWLAKEFKHLLGHTPATSGVIRGTYKAGYCTPLPSRDDTTNLGRSRILSLTSNKRQDFEHAQWELFEQFPRFLSADPENATETLIDILDCYAAEGRRVGDEEVVPLVFGDLPARYQADHSHSWLRRHDDHKTPPVHAFELGLISLVDSGQLEALSNVLGVVIRRNRLACIWASLLRAGAERPDALGRRLLPLLTAPPVLDGLDTRKPAGDLIATLHPLLSDAERIAIEKAVLDTGKYAQPVLLGCMDERHIASQEARDRRRELQEERPLPSNRDPLEITGGWRGVDDDWWLREQGVNLSTEANAALNSAIKAVEGMKPPEGDDAQKSTFLVDRWQQVQGLRETLQSRSDIPEALLMSGWNAVAAAAGRAAEASSTAVDLARFPGITEMIVGALDSALWPLPVADPEREAAFAKMPSWGSPAPRVEGAGALMALARALGPPDPELARLIEGLVRDPSPAVRHQILLRTNMLFDANPPLMWRLFGIGFTEEQNEGVLSFFLPSVGPVLRERPEWFTEQLLALDERVEAEPRADGGRDEFMAHLVQLLLHLWFVYDQTAAGNRVRTWTRDPVEHAKRIQDALTALRDAMVQGDPARPNPTDDRVRTRTIEIFESVVLKVGPLFDSLVGRDLTASERATAETALQVLDQAATEIYFGSGAYAASNRQDYEENHVATTKEVRSRFLREMGPTLAALAQAPYPSVTHHLIETLEQFIPDDPPMVFRLVTDTLVKGGRTGGYQFESLGSDLFVRIVRRYLADFRSVLASDDDLRQRLMGALDVFVEAGWPEARRLVYDLPEMLR